MATSPPRRSKAASLCRLAGVGAWILAFISDDKKAGADAPAESAVLATAYCIVSMLRDCLILEVTLRCSLADRWVYLRGRILPVSVI